MRIRTVTFRNKDFHTLDAALKSAQKARSSPGSVSTPMRFQSTLIALLQVTVALAQTVLDSPITSMVARVAQSTSIRDYVWNTYEVAMGFSFDAATVASIRSGDYFDFAITGSLRDYSDASNVPITYDFYIESDNNDQLFHVVALDNNHSFRATATTFFDQGVISDIAGNFAVDFLFADNTPRSVLVRLRHKLVSWSPLHTLLLWVVKRPVSN